MKIVIKQIHPDGTELEGTLPAVDYDLPLDDFPGWKEIHYRFHVSLTAGQECLVQGSLRSSFPVACARCLEPMPLTIEVPEFVHSFPTAGVEAIDLTDAIREDSLLSLPLAPRCRLDEQQRCPLTGQVMREPASDFADQNRMEVWEALNKFKSKKE
jgi:uncharacterized metal-binding protein YceD (DUF177 family)